MANDSKKKRIYIVGGKGKNVPPWVDAAFDWEQFEQDKSKTRTLEPDETPDAVVVLSSWVGHEHFYGARDLAERLDIPMILSPGGWSASLKAAAELGVEWFITEIDRSRGSDALDEAQVEELDEFIDNAWREAYNREWTAREALERRYSKDRKLLEQARKDLADLKRRDQAAQRVIREIRSAAAAQRNALEEVERRSERVARALLGHIGSLQELLVAAEESHSAVLSSSTKLGSARRLARAKLDALQAALNIAEDGLTTISEDMEEREASSVSASNADTDS